MPRKLIAALALLVFAFSILLAFKVTFSFFGTDTSMADDSAVSIKNEEKKSGGDPAEIRILAAGDMVFHPITYSPQYENVVAPYDFSRWFHRIDSKLEEVDYATVTFETVCDASKPFRGYPVFNSPPEAISVIHEAGFDAYATATNHCLDQGFDAMLVTLEEMDKAGVSRFGCKRETDEAMLIEDIQGVKVAFLNYADAYNGFETALSPSQHERISPLEIENVCRDIERARDEGAEIVAVYTHWGVEYQTLPNQTQISWAHQMAEAGADVIIGSHPHVLQPGEWVENDGRKTFIVYSLGNTMSNQRAAFLGTIDTEIGAFLDMTFIRDRNGVTLEKAELIPSTVYVNKKGNELSYEVAFISDLLEDPSLSTQEKNHVRSLQKRAEEILNTPVPKLEKNKQIAA